MVVMGTFDAERSISSVPVRLWGDHLQEEQR